MDTNTHMRTRPGDETGAAVLVNMVLPPLNCATQHTTICHYHDRQQHPTPAQPPPPPPELPSSLPQPTQTPTPALPYRSRRHHHKRHYHHRHHHCRRHHANIKTQPKTTKMHSGCFIYMLDEMTRISLKLPACSRCRAVRACYAPLVRADCAALFCACSRCSRTTCSTYVRRSWVCFFCDLSRSRRKN